MTLIAHILPGAGEAGAGAGALICVCIFEEFLMCFGNQGLFSEEFVS
jgi:hypothetical protein